MTKAQNYIGVGWWWGGGAHWVLMWHLTRRSLYQCLMPYYAHRCQTSTLITVQINFWQNSDPFSKKEHFSSWKLTELEHFCQAQLQLQLQLQSQLWVQFSITLQSPNRVSSKSSTPDQKNILTQFRLHLNCIWSTSKLLLSFISVESQLHHSWISGTSNLHLRFISAQLQLELDFTCLLASFTFLWACPHRIPNFLGIKVNSNRHKSHSSH